MSNADAPLSLAAVDANAYAQTGLEVPPTSRWSRRGALTAFTTRHLVAWEVVMALIAIAYLILAAKADDAPGSVPTPVLLAFSGLFLCEFAGRFWDAPSRLHYAQGHWLDLVSCIPVIGGLRALRLVRLIRLAAGVRLLAVADGVNRRPDGARDGLGFVLPLVTTVWVAGAYAIWNAEHGVNHNIHSFFDALYWSFTTATTLGYGDITPVTQTGRVIAGMLVFVGVGVLGLASSQLTARFLRSGNREDEVLVELREMRREMAALRGLIEPGGPAQPPENGAR